MKDPRLQPKKARPIKHTQTKAGWWYEQKSGIDVFVQSETGFVFAVRLYWRDILRAAQRSSSREVIVRLAQPKEEA